MTQADHHTRRAAFATQLRAARQAAKLTQIDVATQAAIDRSFYAGVETGRRNISIDKVFAIADALQIDAATLFTAPSPDRSTPASSRSTPLPPDTTPGHG